MTNEVEREKVAFMIITMWRLEVTMMFDVFFLRPCSVSCKTPPISQSASSMWTCLMSARKPRRQVTLLGPYIPSLHSNGINLMNLEPLRGFVGLAMDSMFLLHTLYLINVSATTNYH